MRHVDRTELLIIMTRYPEPGRCKTRLIGTLGEAGAAGLSAALTRWTLQQAEELQATREMVVEVHYEGGGPAGMQGMFGSAWHYLPQLQGNLGVRISGATTCGFARGFRRVVVIGTDCPNLDASMLTLAFERLRKVPIVCGPSLDGGYYLIGMTRPMPHLFRRIPWGTSAVLQETVASAEEAGHEVLCLNPLPDIDTAADLTHLPPAIRTDVAVILGVAMI
jgi:rSAM/selenodomain-associated transferase 1